MCTIIFIAKLFMIIVGVRSNFNFFSSNLLFTPSLGGGVVVGVFVPVLMTNTISPKKKHNIELARTESY